MRSKAIAQASRTRPGLGQTWLMVKCGRCGTNFLVGDATNQFESHFGGLDYQSEITWGAPERLCGDCSIDWMENVIRSQPGYVEPEDWYESRGVVGFA